MRQVLKPGAIFLCYEWCLADRYDLGCAEHVTIRKQIEEGGGLPDIVLTHYCLVALREAGFEILKERDLVNDEYGGWQAPSTGEYLTGAEAPPGRQALDAAPDALLELVRAALPVQLVWPASAEVIKVMEFLRLAPACTSRTQILLKSGGMGLAWGGKLDIFTPMHLMVGRVPLD